MTTTHAPTDPDLADHDPDVDRTKLYVGIALILALLTALEVGTYWFPKEVQHTWYFAAGLCALMVLKFGIVTSYFMHLKWDKKFLTVAFYSGLVLAVGVYIAVLAAFRWFWPASRMVGG